MLYEGHVQGGVVVFEAGDPPAEGTRVRVVPILGPPIPDRDADDATVWVRATGPERSRAWPIEDFSDWGPPDGR